MKFSQEIIGARRAETQKIIRGKYGLPSREMRVQDPFEYIRYLEGIAAANDVSVRPYYEYSSHPNAKLATHSVKMGGIFLPTERNVYGHACNFEHELVHALQYLKYPRMHSTQQEYEAYLIGWGSQFLADPEYTKLFGWVIGCSLRINKASGNLYTPYTL